MWYSVYFRVILTILSFSLSIFQFIEGNIGNGIFLIFITLLVGLTIFINEIIILAFLQIRKGNLAKSEKYLNIIKKPHLMKKTQEAYYNYLRGLMISQNQPMKSEALFKKALNLGLRMKHDRAMAALNLAGIHAMKRRKREAQKWIEEAKKYDTRKMLTDQIKMLKKQLTRL